MPKNQRPAPKKSSTPPPQKEEDLVQKLCDMALELAEREDDEESGAALRQQESNLNKLLKKSVYQKKDDILYEALEQAKHEDTGAYLLLKERIEEASEVVITARGDGKNAEINAFVIPLFAYTTGGLNPEDCFEDQEAFELLSQSLQEHGLESRDATVVLVNHAYHLDEIDAITFSHLNDMVRDAYAAMTNKRTATTPAIDRSFGGWPEGHFAADDQAVELRFLLGFASKATDDAFYRIPDDEAKADAYFAARAERFQHWCEQVTPLVKRCLVASGTDIEVNFLYQDLFHGGKERGIAEYFMLQLLSELNHIMDEKGIDPASVKAIVGPAEIRDELVLRVNLHTTADDNLLGTAEKPLPIGTDLEGEIIDLNDALTAIGITNFIVASKFDEDGKAIDAKPFNQQ